MQKNVVVMAMSTLALGRRKRGKYRKYQLIGSGIRVDQKREKNITARWSHQVK